MGRQAVSGAFEGVEQVVMLQHLFHGDPGTDVPEINEGFLGMGYSFQGSKCGSGIEPRPMDDDTMPAQAAGLWKTLVQQTCCFAVPKSFPMKRKETGLSLQSAGVGEKKKPPAVFQPLTRCDHARHPL